MGKEVFREEIPRPYSSFINELEEENKNLKIEIGGLMGERDGKQMRIDKLEEENKKLNIKVASLEGEIKGLNYTIEKLKEENQTLELWLDNKEKLNEEYRKQIDKLREELSAYDREYFDEDKKAKNIYKKQYEHSMGEDDELIYEEGLYD